LTVSIARLTGKSLRREFDGIFQRHLAASRPRGRPGFLVAFAACPTQFTLKHGPIGGERASIDGPAQCFGGCGNGGRACDATSGRLQRGDCLEGFGNPPVVVELPKRLQSLASKSCGRASITQQERRVSRV
jgi:hypothetical protein